MIPILTLRNRRASKNIHRRVHQIVLFLALWLIFALWGFGGPATTNYLLSIVTGFIGLSIALPLLLSRVRRNDDSAARSWPRFGEWLTNEFETWQSRLKGWDALIEMALPLSAIALGMTAFAIIFNLTEHAAI